MSTFGDAIFGEDFFGEDAAIDQGVAGGIMPTADATAEPYVPPVAHEVVKPIDWDIYTMRPNSTGRDQLLTQARSRSFTFDLYQPDSCSFILDGNHPEAKKIDDFITDIYALRNGVDIFRGRTIGVSDTVTENEFLTNVNATSYKGLLSRRELKTAIDTYSTPEEQATIAWNMIQQTQSVAGGNLSITRGPYLDTGVKRGDRWDQGKYIATAIDDIAQRQYGFDWSIDHKLEFNVHYPARGSLRAYTALYPGNVTSFSRSVDTSTYANSVRAMGDDNGTPIQYLTSVSDIADRPEGLWDYAEGGGDASSAAEIESLSKGLLATKAGIVPTWTLVLRQGEFEPFISAWVGDTIRLRIKHGRLDVNGLYRIQQIKFTIDESNRETVELTVGSPVVSAANRLWYYGRRLDELERR